MDGDGSDISADLVRLAAPVLEGLKGHTAGDAVRSVIDHLLATPPTVVPAPTPAGSSPASQTSQ